jgi:hypothetical protein
MHRYHQSANTEQRYVYYTPAGEALTRAGQGFILTASLTLAIVIFANLAAIALDSWSPATFRRILLWALAPWGFLIIGILWRLVQFAWPALERATHRDLDRSGQTGDPIRFIKWRGPEFAAADIHPYEADLRYFIRAITTGYDWTQRSWRGQELPSGTTCHNEYYAALIQPLVDAGVIVGRTEGSKGVLTTTDATHIERLVGLHD